MAERPARSDIVVLTTDPGSRARLRAALEPVGEVHVAASAAELRAAASTRRAAAIVIELGNPGERETAPLAASLRRDFPSVPILVYCELTVDHVRVLPELIQAGVDRLIIRGIDDVGSAVRQVLARASADRIALDALEALTGIVPPEQSSVVAYCLAHAHRPLRVSDVARALAVHRKTLCNRAVTASFPPPSELISWCRLLHAARLLDDTGRSVEQVALMLGFGSGTGLRNMLRRYTELTPTPARRDGAFAAVLARMRDRIREAASGGRARGGGSSTTQRPARRGGRSKPGDGGRRGPPRSPRAPSAGLA